VSWDSPAARAFAINSVPTSLIVGTDGRILWRGHPLDGQGDKDLAARIALALGEEPHRD
jgi:hypothetical protein